MNKLQRRSIRLKNYDYTQNGFYFITICIHNKVCLLGEITDKKMVLNDAGLMIEKLWYDIPKYYEGFLTHKFIVMPNHIHGIIEISSHGSTQGCSPTVTNLCRGGVPSPPNLNKLSLSDVLKRFKTLTTNRYIHGVKHHHWKRFDKHLWQRSFYEHIIRNEKTFEEIQTYIINNPINWEKDSLYI